MEKKKENQNLENTDNIEFFTEDKVEQKRREIYDNLFSPFVTYEQFSKADYQLILLNLAMLIDDKKKFREYLEKTISEIKKM